MNYKSALENTHSSQRESLLYALWSLPLCRQETEDRLRELAAARKQRARELAEEKYYAERRVSVALYWTEQAYGGPEEGGWWYDTGCDARFGKEMHIEESAAYQNRLRRVANWRNKREGNRPRSSVISNGEWAVHVEFGPLTDHYPQTRPHYE